MDQEPTTSASISPCVKFLNFGFTKFKHVFPVLSIHPPFPWNFLVHFDEWISVVLAASDALLEGAEHAGDMVFLVGRLVG